VVRLALASLLLFASCGVQNVREPPARLQVIAEPENARVYVDERYMATARVLERRPQQLRTGPHRVTIEAPGFFPHDVEVDLPSGTTTIRISLRAVPE